jgi:hypothetical protein
VSYQGRNRADAATRRATVLRLHAAGCTNAAIAERTGLRSSSVSGIIRRDGQQANRHGQGDYEGGPIRL